MSSLKVESMKCLLVNRSLILVQAWLCSLMDKALDINSGMQVRVLAQPHCWALLWALLSCCLFNVHQKKRQELTSRINVILTQNLRPILNVPQPITFQVPKIYLTFCYLQRLKMQDFCSVLSIFVICNVVMIKCLKSVNLVMNIVF